MKVLLIPAFVILELFAGSGSALAAATVTTPFVIADVAGICAMTNVAKKPATVTVRVLASDAGATAPNTDLCSPAPLGPGQSCLVIAAIPSEAPAKDFLATVSLREGNIVPEVGRSPLYCRSPQSGSSHP